MSMGTSVAEASHLVDSGSWFWCLTRLPFFMRWPSLSPEIPDLHVIDHSNNQ
jgi:hypothetical protein